ncbi:hypothetical protein LCGC14_0945450 [marine sediment metagenome]|uniref:Uncharacterized protein n=1 Tax=marine sediment metagenome TaxID=412755 RepID=A0A0F9RQ83_9ZZZZ
MILIISGVFFTFAEMIKEQNDNFPNRINSTEWEDKYDYIDDINETFYPIETKLKTIQDEEAGWFSKLTAGITAIPYAILIMPQAVFGSLLFGGQIVVGFFNVWGLPQKIVTLVLVLILIWGIFKLIEFFNKTEV